MGELVEVGQPADVRQTQLWGIVFDPVLIGWADTGRRNKGCNSSDDEPIPL